MSDVRLYYSDMCERSKELLEYMEDKNTDGIKMMDATKDIKLQVEIHKLGGKSEVPMLYMDGKAIYDGDQIRKEIDNM